MYIIYTCIQYIYIYFYCQDIPHRKRSNKEHVENHDQLQYPSFWRSLASVVISSSWDSPRKMVGQKHGTRMVTGVFFPKYGHNRFDSYPNMNASQCASQSGGKKNL